MKEQKIAKIYADSITAISKENSVDLVSEITKVVELLNSSNQLEKVLFLDAFKVEDKIHIFNTLSEKIGLNKIVTNFVNYLINEKRFGIFHEIYKEIVVRDDREKGFLSGVIEGASETPNEEFKAKLTTYLEKKLGKKINLKYKKITKYRLATE